MDWQEAARAEIAGLKRHWILKHNWQPEMVEADDHIDLFVRLRGVRLGEATYTLRLRYQADWMTAGRREAFVDPTNRTQAGPEFWPQQKIRGVNPNYRDRGGVLIPCICLRGVWGYHSVLHTDRRAEGTTLLSFLLELQAVINE